MKTRILAVLTLLLFSVAINAQNKKEALKALKTINSPSQVKAFKKKYSDWTIQKSNTLGIDSLKHQKVVNAKIGEVFTRKYDNGKVNVVFKVLARRNEEIYKVKYVYFDGSKMSKIEIDSLRTIIINKYKNGSDFSDLAKEYTMDGNPTGDLVWFYKGMMVEEFEAAVKPKLKGDIFTVDVESKKWYYVVLKTHSNIITSITEAIGIKYDL